MKAEKEGRFWRFDKETKTWMAVGDTHVGEVKAQEPEIDVLGEIFLKLKPYLRIKRKYEAVWGGGKKELFPTLFEKYCFPPEDCEYRSGAVGIKSNVLHFPVCWSPDPPREGWRPLTFEEFQVWGGYKKVGEQLHP